MANAKSHWLLMFPSSLDLIPRLTQGEGTMLLTSPTLKSWSLFTLFLWNYFLPNYCSPLGRMASLFQFKITVIGIPILFEFLHILLAISLCYISLDELNSDFQTCNTAFLLPFPWPSASSFWSTSLTLCPFPKVHSETPPFSLLQPNPQTGQRQIQRRETTGMEWGSGCHWVKILPCMVRQCCCLVRRSYMNFFFLNLVLTKAACSTQVLSPLKSFSHTWRACRSGIIRCLLYLPKSA